MSDYTTKTRLNIATTAIKEAENYTNWLFTKQGKDYKTIIPKFHDNYKHIKEKIKEYSLEIPRNAMPVIEPKDMKKFEADVKKGNLMDLFAPYVPGKAIFPEDYYSIIERKHNVNIRNIHKIKPNVRMVPANRLKPLQSQVWLNLVDNYILQYGIPTSSSKTVKTTIIISREMYILDGHHRWAQVMLSKPSLKMQTFFIPLDVRQLLELTKVYGVAIGNKPNQ